MLFAQNYLGIFKLRIRKNGIGFTGLIEPKMEKRKPAAEVLLEKTSTVLLLHRILMLSFHQYPSEETNKNHGFRLF